MSDDFLFQYWGLNSRPLAKQELYGFYFIFERVFLKFIFIVRGGVHCGTYKSSYTVSNISYLNSPPPPLFFIPLLPCIPGMVSTVSFLN
jgi:hypothetical protein